MTLDNVETVVVQPDGGGPPITMENPTFDLLDPNEESSDRIGRPPEHAGAAGGGGGHGASTERAGAVSVRRVARRPPTFPVAPDDDPFDDMLSLLLLLLLLLPIRAPSPCVTCAPRRPSATTCEVRRR